MRKLVFALLAVTLVLSSCANHGQQQSESPTPSQSQSISETPSATPLLLDPEEMKVAADAFYAEYVDCLTNPPAEAKDRVSVWCQQHNSYGAAELYENLVKGGVAAAGADPVACAQDLPRSFTAVKAGVSNRMYGWVRVEADFSTRLIIGLRMRQGFDHPIVTMVNCPIP